MTENPAPFGPAKVLRAFGTYEHGQMHFRMAKPEEPVHAPLLCMHMSPSSGRIYTRLLSHLGTDRVGLAVDTPGFGETDVPSHPLEIADFAKANFGLLDQLGLTDAVDVMGYHTGALTASEMALHQPERVRRIILIFAPVFTETELEQNRTNYAHQETKEDGGHLVDLWKALRFWGDKTQTLESTMEHYAEHIRGGENSWWGHRAAFNCKLQETLPELAQPILVLNTEDDLHEQSLRAEPLMQNGRIHELPGWAHGFLDIYTEQVAALIREFLDTDSARHS